MNECPNCKTPKQDADPVCANCKEFALQLLKHLQPEMNETIRQLLRDELRDRDIVEFKTAQIAASKIVEWIKPFGYVAACLLGLGWTPLSRPENGFN